jgi:hypothetical protein
MDVIHKKSIWLEGIQDKNHHEDGAKCAFNFLYRVEGQKRSGLEFFTKYKT